MIRLIVVTRDGASHVLDGKIGASVMEAIREAAIEAVFAICGGCCSCATCHVHVGEAYAPLLPPMGDDERRLLDRSGRRTPASRLSCQLPVLAALEGARFVIAP